jgi:A/G-specific adenine glycosylase
MKNFQSRLLTWFASNARPLPWRANYEPYAVWISEVMLQQTQMERGVAYFERWMERFPDARALAAASEEEILKYWEGLGYYNRARNLRKAALRLVNEHGGRVPDDVEALRALPGVGEYTAAAVASIAYNQDVPVVDANVERVLARVFDVDTPVKEEPARSRVRVLAERLLPPGQSRDFNQALMEFGALVCSKKPRCECCPLAELCESRRLGIVDERPVPGKSQDIVTLDVVSGVLVRHGRVFIQKRLPRGAWPGLWEFPGGRIEPGETPEQALVRELREELDFGVETLGPFAPIKHGYTRYRVNLHCFFCRQTQDNPTPTLTAATEYRWALPQELDEYAFPAGHRKLIDRMTGRREGQESGEAPLAARLAALLGA